jgi:hypothetical protein
MNFNSKGRGRRPLRIGVGLLVLAIGTSVLTIPRAHAQSFDSGSDGSEGALLVGANQGTIVFDPFEIGRWGKVLDPDGDGVYNFTTITINSGSTLRFQGDKINKPVYWLATGSVVVNGTLDFSGANGVSNNVTDLTVRRQVAVPGAGGYAGGVGGIVNSSVPASPGEGPGGGAGGLACPLLGGLPRLCGKSGTFTGNRYLIPLVGGSGGEGALWDTVYSGGAGGGAVLIASSTSITVGGTIVSQGGNPQGGVAGSGSGGAIRLVAPTLAGGGQLDVRGGSNGGPNGFVNAGSPGWVRLEGFTISNSLSFAAGVPFLTRGSPVDSSSLRPAGAIRITAIDGVAVAPNPSGSFVLPDVTISKNTAVNVDIQASGIPSGTVVTLQIYPQSPTDPATVYLPTAQATLNGTLQSSTATATFTFPYGFSRGFVRASWTQ